MRINENYQMLKVLFSNF